MGTREWEIVMLKVIRLGLVVFVLVAVLCTTCFACLKWSKVFKDTYKPDPESALGKAKCAVCHIDAKGKEKVNPYGAMLKGKKIEAALLKPIEKKDADKDGFSNIAEIKAGTLPGDPKSKPAKK